MSTTLTPQMLLSGYAQGCFPMAEERNSSKISWYAPDPRGIIPLHKFHIPKTLGKLVRQDRFRVVTNQDFRGTMMGCAERESTWISDDIIDAYTQLYTLGYAHSIECWVEDRLVGGLYGVALGGAFFGESMFSRVRDASKVALVHLVYRLRAKGYVLLDTQFTTPHLERFGAVEIPKELYERELKKALSVHVAPWDHPYQVDLLKN